MPPLGKTSKQSGTGRPLPDEETPAETLERLIREQGVKPVNLEEFAKLWPDEFDADAFNAWLAEDRAARRAIAAGKKG